ncbi:MAG TPA: hypothetical protein VLF93_01360 [Candidatus Saccharimonadales bacterium]|nr:hypothetical protein [Candidatus Saccharimonadales bacterium]
MGEKVSKISLIGKAEQRRFLKGVFTGNVDQVAASQSGMGIAEQQTAKNGTVMGEKPKGDKKTGK